VEMVVNRQKVLVGQLVGPLTIMGWPVVPRWLGREKCFETPESRRVHIAMDLDSELLHRQPVVLHPLGGCSRKPVRSPALENGKYRKPVHKWLD
jgi:hypothetical protein